VLWNALAGARATGTVASVAPIATVQNGVNTYEVVVSLQALPTGVRIGQTTTMTVTVGRADGVLRVPTAAVRGAGGRYTVQVVNGTRTETVPVQVGLQGDAFVEITEGLVDGQQVALAQQSTTGTTGGQVPGGGGFRGGGLTGGGGPGGLGNGGNGRGGG
jgi:macrolide-specific efflux system membrane fusion protein